MMEPKRPVNSHHNYHAHIYFDEQTKELAKQLCDISRDRFQLEVGRFHEKPIGPHPCWSCQVSLTAKDFDEYITWLDENRQGLTIFVHPVTGDNIKDHTELAYWLGQEQALNLAIFNRK